MITSSAINFNNTALLKQPSSPKAMSGSSMPMLEQAVVTEEGKITFVEKVRTNVTAKNEVISLDKAYSYV